jgi:hypothetical protein
VGPEKSWAEFLPDLAKKGRTGSEQVFFLLKFTSFPAKAIKNPFVYFNFSIPFCILNR